MVLLDTDEIKLFSKYWGRNDLIGDEEFWQDVYNYYSQDLRDAPLPLMFNPYTVRRIQEMLKCPPGECNKCCYYDNIQLNSNDIKRLFENISYTEDDLSKLITTKDNTMSLSGQSSGCPFLKEKSCTIHKFRPDCCYIFPISGKEAVNDGEKVKQMQIRIICEPAMVVAREIITEALNRDGNLLLPDLTIIPREK